jgi:hypothetical protein
LPFCFMSVERSAKGGLRAADEDEAAVEKMWSERRKREGLAVVFERDGRTVS